MIRAAVLAVLFLAAQLPAQVLLPPDRFSFNERGLMPIAAVQPPLQEADRLVEVRYADMQAKLAELFVRIDAEAKLRETSEKSVSQHFDLQDKAVQAALSAAKEAVSAALTAAKEAVAAALTAAKEAVDKAQIANNEHFAVLNEFRGQQRDIIASFALRTEMLASLTALADKLSVMEKVLNEKIDALAKALNEKQDALTARVALIEGRGIGANATMGWLVAAATFGIGLIGTVFLVVRRPGPARGRA